MRKHQRETIASGPAPPHAGRPVSRHAVVAASVAAAALLTATVMVGGALIGPTTESAPSQTEPAQAAQVAGDAAASSAAATWARQVVDPNGLVDRLGIRVTQVALTGGGGLIDLRFQVVDPDKAAALHDPGSPPAIVDDRTRVVARDLLMGHAHSGVFKAGLTYFLMFENPGSLVERGDTVSVLLGNTQLDHIEVE